MTVPAPEISGQSMPRRARRSRVRAALSAAWAIAWRRSSQPRRCWPARCPESAKARTRRRLCSRRTRLCSLLSPPAEAGSSRQCCFGLGHEAAHYLAYRQDFFVPSGGLARPEHTLVLTARLGRRNYLTPQAIAIPTRLRAPYAVDQTKIALSAAAVAPNSPPRSSIRRRLRRPAHSQRKPPHHQIPIGGKLSPGPRGFSFLGGFRTPALCARR